MSSSRDNLRTLMKKDGLNFDKNTSMRQTDNSLNLSSLLNRSKKPE